MGRLGWGRVGTVKEARRRHTRLHHHLRCRTVDIFLEPCR